MNPLKKIARRLISSARRLAAAADARSRGEEIRRCATLAPDALLGPRAVLYNHHGDPRNITIGRSSSVHGELMISLRGGRIAIGEKTFVGVGSRVWSAAQVIIGDYVLISHNVDIHDSNTHSLDWRERRLELDRMLPTVRQVAHDFDVRARPLVIEDDVWIGFGAAILGGVRIGRGAVVGARTVVTKDVPAFARVSGNPMRILAGVDG